MPFAPITLKRRAWIRAPLRDRGTWSRPKEITMTTIVHSGPAIG